MENFLSFFEWEKTDWSQEIEMKMFGGEFLKIWN